MRLASLRQRISSLLRAALLRSGRQITRWPPTLAEHPEARLTIGLEDLLTRLVLKKPDVYFVEIGAYDGRSGDQLHEWVTRFGWHGTLVEPHPRHFAELERTYAGRPGLELRNVAIAERAEKRTLYGVRDGVEGVPKWAPQIASFDRSHVDSRRWAGASSEELLEEIPVECLPFSELLRDVETVDLLQVDTEGFDAEVIRMFDFEKYHPFVVRFESRHLTREAHDSALRRLSGYGYALAVDGPDTIAWRDARPKADSGWPTPQAVARTAGAAGEPAAGTP